MLNTDKEIETLDAIVMEEINNRLHKIKPKDMESFEAFNILSCEEWFLYYAMLQMADDNKNTILTGQTLTEMLTIIRNDLEKKAKKFLDLI